jgi:hypothetical protein
MLPSVYSKSDRLERRGRLPPVSGAFVGDVADVVGIETLRSTPLIVDRAARVEASFDRAVTLSPRFVDSSQADLLPQAGHARSVA